MDYAELASRAEDVTAPQEVTGHIKSNNNHNKPYLSFKRSVSSKHRHPHIWFKTVQ